MVKLEQRVSLYACALFLITACQSNRPSPQPAIAVPLSTVQATKPHAASSAAPPSEAAAAPAFAPLKPLDPEKIEAAARALNNLQRADSDSQLRILLELLAETEEGRLPATVTSALSAGSAEFLGVDGRARVIHEAVTETPEALAAWKHACRDVSFGDGGHVLDALGGESVASRTKVFIILVECRLENRGLVSGPQEIGQDYDLLIFAHTIQAYLEQRGGLVPLEMQILNLIARGNRGLTKPITLAELASERARNPAQNVTTTQLAALRKRINEAIALLDKEDYESFAKSLLDPRFVIPSRKLDVRNKRNAILSLLKRARDTRPFSYKDEAHFLLPWRPGVQNRFVFREHRGVWYLEI